MQVRRWKKTGWAALLAAAVLAAASWWAGQRPYTSPGAHVVLRQDSDLGALLGFIVVMATACGALASAVLKQNGKVAAAARARRLTAGGFGLYLAAVVLVSLVAPRTIVSIGDGYCYDLWCIGVEQVKAAPEGQEVVYTADVRIFSDANRVPTSRETSFLHVMDERGRRFPLIENSEVTVKPHESVQASFTFRVPVDARKLYLTGEYPVMPWVYLYFGSDFESVPSTHAAAGFVGEISIYALESVLRGDTARITL